MKFVNKEAREGTRFIDNEFAGTTLVAYKLEDKIHLIADSRVSNDSKRIREEKINWKYKGILSLIYWLYLLIKFCIRGRNIRLYLKYCSGHHEKIRDRVRKINCTLCRSSDEFLKHYWQIIWLDRGRVPRCIHGNWGGWSGGLCSQLLQSTWQKQGLPIRNNNCRIRFSNQGTPLVSFYIFIFEIFFLFYVSFLIFKQIYNWCSKSFVTI